MKKNILLVSTHVASPDYSDRKEILDTLKGYLSNLDAEISVVMLEDLKYTVLNGVVKIVMPDGKDVAEFDLAYVKNWRSLETSATALAIYLEKHDCKVICSELKNYRVTDKIAEAFVLALHDIPYPDTLFVSNTKQVEHAIESTPDFSYPLIVKAVDGSAGQDNYMVKTRQELHEIMLSNTDKVFMVQNLIENDGDHRVLVLGYKPALSFKRMRLNDETHLNNTSQGGNAELTALSEYSKEIISDCIKAARLVNREIAGVDVLIDRISGKHYILEVNASPQVSTGAYLEEKKIVLEAYFREELESL